MTAKVRLLDEAIAELGDASAWYEEQQVGLGLVFLAAVDRAIEHASRWPLTGALIDGVDESLEVRRMTVGSFPYYVAYVSTEPNITVLTWRSLTSVDALAIGAAEPTDPAEYWPLDNVRPPKNGHPLAYGRYGAPLGPAETAHNRGAERPAGRPRTGDMPGNIGVHDSRAVSTLRRRSRPAHVPGRTQSPSEAT